MPTAKLTFKQQIEGFPVWQIAVTSMVRFAEPIAFTSLFPYVYFMVRDFHIAENEADIAKYVGYLSSSFAFFQFLSSIHWGHAADLIGRKRVLLCGLLSTAFAMVLFGFSTNYYMAPFARSLMGTVNGNIAVIRTVLGEIAVQKRHQAIAFSTLPLLWQAGCIVGPFLGGALTNVDVEKEYTAENTTFHKMIAPLAGQFEFTDSALKRLTENYPYALSNIVVSSGLVTCAMICFLFFEETHEYWRFKKDYGVEIGDRLIRLTGYEPPVRPWARGYPHEAPQILRTGSSNSVKPFRRSSLSQLPNELAGENTPLLPNDISENAIGNDPSDVDDDEVDDVSSIDSSQSDVSVQSIGPITRRQSLALIHTYSRKSNMLSEEVQRNNGYEWGVLASPQVFFSIFCNFGMSLSNIVVDEFLPVFLARKTARLVEGDLTSPLKSKFPFKITGGLNFSPTEVGDLLSSTGTVGVLLVIFVYPYIDRNFDPIKSFRTFILMTPFIYFVIPLLVFTLPPNTPSIAYTKAALYTVTFSKVLSTSMSFPQVMLLIHRASPAKNRAFVNGTTISATSFARCIGPLIWGFIMSWADAHEKGWITWWSMAVVATNSAIPAFLLKDTEEETNVGGAEA